MALGPSPAPLLVLDFEAEPSHPDKELAQEIFTFRELHAGGVYNAEVASRLRSDGGTGSRNDNRGSLSFPTP